MAVGAVGVMVYWPRLKPKPRDADAVEKVAGDYLDALVRQDEETARQAEHGRGASGDPLASRRLSTRRPATDDQGLVRALAGLHKRIDAEFTYDSAAGRFTPKNALGIAGETLDALHAAKDEAEKSGMYKKMQSGDPNDIFDAAEQYGKVFEKLAKSALTPKRLLPTYKMLVESAKPPLLRGGQGAGPRRGRGPQAVGRPAQAAVLDLKPDGPFIYEEAEVTATGRDRLASLGDPPSRLRLKLVRFRLEGIDTGWKVVSARRVQPGDDKPAHGTGLTRPAALGSYSTGHAVRRPRSPTAAPAPSRSLTATARGPSSPRSATTRPPRCASTRSWSTKVKSL